MKKHVLFILTAITLAFTANARAQFGRDYWRLKGDTLFVVNPTWYIRANNFMPLSLNSLLYNDLTFRQPIQYFLNPVFTPGRGNAISAEGIADPCVVYDSTGWHMWFLAIGNNNTNSIGYAISSDGIHWTMQGDSAVLSEGPAGAWDHYLWEARVIRDDGEYKMYYQGATSPDSAFKTGYATSSDGIHWTKYTSNPIFAGTPNTWNSMYAGARSIIHLNNLYYMFYEGGSTTAAGAMGLATSTDGVTFTNVSTSSPALSGHTTSWDSTNIVPNVIYSNGLFICVYSTNSNYSGSGYIGLATSMDGKTWNKYQGNPLGEIVDKTAWDSTSGGFSTVTSSVMLSGSAYPDIYLYFRAPYRAKLNIGVARLNLFAASSPIWLNVNTSTPGLYLRQTGSGDAGQFLGSVAATRYNVPMDIPTAPTGTPSSTGGHIANGTYYYAITATDNIGESALVPQSISNPVIVSGGTNTGSVSLSWPAVIGAQSYKVYRDTSGIFASPCYLATVTTTSYTDTAASAKTGNPPPSNTANVFSLKDTTAYYLGSHLGIDKSNPSYALDVNGDINLGFQQYLRLNTNPAVVTSVGGLFFGWVTAPQAISGTIQFPNSGTYAMRINNNGVTKAAFDSTGIIQCGGYLVTSSTQSFTNTTTLANITGLGIVLQSGHTYGFEVNLFGSVATSAGEKFAVTYSGTSSYAIYDVLATSSALATSASNWTTTLGTAITDAMSNVNSSCNIRGTIVTTSSGTLNIQYAQNTAQATANTIQRGSAIRVWQIN